MIPRLILSLALGMLAVGCASSAQASPISIDLSISYDTAVSGLPGSLNGTAQFYSAPGVLDTQFALGSPISIGEVSLGQTFSTILTPTDPCFGQTQCAPTDPCFGQTQCSLGFEFTGSTQGFPAYAFETGNVPTLNPGFGSIIPLNIIYPTDPCYPSDPCRVSGPIVAFDAPVQVGTWQVSITAVPAPGTLPLFAGGLGALGMLGWRRKRKASALVVISLPTFGRVRLRGSQCARRRDRTARSKD